MKIGIKIRLIASSFILLVFFISCDNKNEIKDFKKQNINKTQAIEKERIKYQQDIDSLSREIDSLSETKSKIKERVDFAETEIFRIVRDTHLDHVILGSKNLNDLKIFFEEILGFTIKSGNQHKNGISNFFIEFSNGSEIEILTVENPTDKLANDYYKLLENNKYGLQFSLRTNEVSDLRKHLTTLKHGYENFAENKIYSTLSTKNMNKELPLFFIQFNNEHKNTLTNHLNKSNGIKSVWFSTRDIKKTARQLVDFGFNVVGNYDLPTFKNKLVQFKNNNFEIILIEADKYKITGLTILVEDINFVKTILKAKFNNDFIEQKENIFFNPSQTKSIWIEFTSE